MSINTASVSFKEKQYGYKVVDKYGDKLGEIHTDGMVPLFESTRGCSPKNTAEMLEIWSKMDALEKSSEND